MISIELKPLQHRGKEWIGIYFQHLPAINSLLKQKLNARWSQTHQCWYIPCSKKSFQQLKSILQKTATLETAELKKYLEQRNQVISTNIHLLKAEKS